MNAGRGVGMSIVRQSVESHGGKLSVVSMPQKGARFTITIPLLAQEEPTAASCEYEQLPLVLIVDDSSSIREQVVKFVTDLGYRTISAADGAEALELLLNGLEPSLILSDVEMPNMNGWEFLEYVKTDHNFGHVPVVLITSLDSEDYRCLATKLGASDYVVKPFGSKQLEHVLGNLFPSQPSSWAVYSAGSRPCSARRVGPLRSDPRRYARCLTAGAAMPFHPTRCRRRTRYSHCLGRCS